MTEQNVDLGREESLSDYIQNQAERLSQELNRHMFDSFAPDNTKVLRKFTAAEASDLIGTSTSNLRKLHSEGKIPDAETDSRGRRLYSAEEIHKIRDYLAIEGRNTDIFRPGRRSPQDQMQVIALANFKGGSGKSTTSIHMAQRFALKGYKVLAVDMDPQASLTTMFGYRPEIAFAEGGTIYDVLDYENPAPLSSIIRDTYFPNLDLAPAGIMLSEYETETALALQRGARVSGAPFYSRLTQALLTVDDYYDIVFIDCPPQIGFLTLTALTASTGVVTTIIPAMYDVASMAQFLMLAGNLMRTIEQAGINPDWAFMKYLLSRYEHHDGAQSQMAHFLRMMFGDNVMENPVVKSTVILDASSTQETIYEIPPTSVNKKTLERALQSMNAAANELEVLVQQAWERPVPDKGAA
ncbi:chromosome partitioning protein ParA [Roseivivax halodurans JCM 10272]|uniref:Chromosome partitioning protein ParA n=1 Tax=Roseivivax halodurans JCM 10272 TaxID=1449350 RepID=X7EED1_9RHOB|nr:plasmid partitioning protein RepA [Roseivivax halodurans]ETX13571.1 chromosome partitioning protein ParA [Roseivivax halodurans JCM 10272]